MNRAQKHGIYISLIGILTGACAVGKGIYEYDKFSRNGEEKTYREVREYQKRCMAYSLAGNNVIQHGIILGWVIYQNERTRKSGRNHLKMD